MTRLLRYLLVFLLAQSMAWSQPAGRAVKIQRVVDGDTVITTSSEVIRLHCIDAPELSQTLGDRSREHLVLAVNNKDVVIYVTGENGNREPIAELFLGDRNIGLEMVRSGRAFVDSDNCEDERYAKAESSAKAEGAGVWLVWRSDGALPMPWQYRKRAKEISITTHVIDIPQASVSGLKSSLAAPSTDGGTASPAATPRATVPKPSTSGVYTPSTRESTSGRTIHTGPRGGRYTISPSGKKVYIKKK